MFGFIRTGDHKIPAHIEIETTKKKRGVSIWLLREGFWENFTRA